MRGRGLMWTGLIGFVVGLLALLICLLLPVVAGPNVSWSEAMLGIVPSGVVTLIFLAVMFIGMVTTLSDHQSPRGRLRDRDGDDEDDDDDDERDRGRRRAR